METEIINKLFLELSQFTKAKTKRELELEKGIRLLINFIPDGWEVPLGWTVVVSQARKLIEKEGICPKCGGDGEKFVDV